ncbi:MAG: hypothetical protein FD174_983 [Geobacteraceae bacterium]|nr:MAG: hypothetical protein FD174_983 [Geobacteraceae bacterium]
MKVLFFTASFPPPAAGGSVEYIFNIISNLPPESVEVHTGNAEPDFALEFDRSFPQNIIRHSYIIHVVDGFKASKLDRLREYLLWPASCMISVLMNRPDVIHIGEYNISGLAALAAYKLFKIPYVLYTYAEEITYLGTRPLHNKLFLAVLKNAEAVITVSEYTRDLLTARGADPARIHKILPAVGHQKITNSSSEELELTRGKFGLNGKKVLLTVGRLVERKGHDVLIKALPSIIQSYPTTHYVIVGSGPQENVLKKLVSEMLLDSHVTFTGRLDDKELGNLYEICDIFIMPHRLIVSTMDTEGCPTVFLEAGAHSKPVIGGNAGGVADAILDGKTGYIVDGTDEDALAEKILHLFKHPELMTKMGAAGRQYTSTLTPERNGDAVRRLSEELINNRSCKQNKAI